MMKTHVHLGRVFFLYIICLPSLFLSNSANAQDACIPGLLAPQNGAEVDNGCNVTPDAKNWRFDWVDCEAAEKYHLIVQGGTSTYPTIDIDTLRASEFIFAGYGYVVDRNRLDWSWKVRAYINDAWGPWSEEWSFDVEPINTDCEGICVVKLIAPENGRIIENGCVDNSVEMRWDFGWTTCEGASNYHLYVENIMNEVVLIDNDSIAEAEYIYLSYTHIPDDQRHGWQWKVRSLIGEEWMPWSQKFNFYLDHPGTDCVITSIPSMESSNFQVYPLPTRDLIFISAAAYQLHGDEIIRIYGIDGKIRHAPISVKHTTNTFEVDLSTFPAGLYVISISTAATSLKLKALVKK